MDIFEFGDRCKPLNKAYKELFGYIPNQFDFNCSREEYLNALEKSVLDKKRIEYYLEQISGKYSDSAKVI